MAKLLLLLLSGAKLGKLLVTGGSMLLSVVMYSFVFGWRYALGLVLMLFLHEMGHYLAARQRGLAVGRMVIIPFLGAATILKNSPHDAETDAWVSLGGPLLGSAAALACYVWARDTDSNLLLAIAYAGFFVNLINLIPISPLDGGHITAVLTPRIWLLGVPILIGVCIWNPSPILILIGLLAAPQVWKAIKYRSDSPEGQTYYAVSAAVRVEYTFYYLTLVIFLAVMCNDLHDMLGAARVAANT